MSKRTGSASERNRGDDFRAQSLDGAGQQGRGHAQTHQRMVGRPHPNALPTGRCEAVVVPCGPMATPETFYPLQLGWRELGNLRLGRREREKTAGSQKEAQPQHVPILRRHYCQKRIYRADRHSLRQQAHRFAVGRVAQAIHDEREEQIGWGVLLQASGQLSDFAAKPLVAELPKRGTDGCWLVPCDRLGAHLSADQIPVNCKFVQRSQQPGVGRNDRHWDNSTVGAACFRPIVLQHDMQNDIVVAGIPIVPMLPPGVGSEMNFDAAREQAPLTEIDERLLKVRPQSM